MTDFIAIEADFIGTIMGNMVISTKSTASFWLAIVITTELELPKAEVTWNTGLERDPIMTEPIVNIPITLQPASTTRIHSAVGLQALFNSRIRHLEGGIINCDKGEFSSSRMSGKATW